MPKIIRLTEGDIHRMVENAVKRVIKEERSIKSDKLQAIVSKYGGIVRNNGIDVHNLSDDDIITVMPYNVVREITSDKNYYVDHGRWADNFGLDAWAKRNGVKTIPGDRIGYIELKGGNDVVVVINRNEYQTKDREGEGYDAYSKKRDRREHDRNMDGSKRYIHKLYDPERFTMWKNPYKKTTWTSDDIDSTMDRIRERRKKYKDTGELTGGLRKMY